jgi:hypothetical protein
MNLTETTRATTCLCGREEGLLSFWKGNVPQLLRIFPYSAAQLTANDQYKRLLAGWAARWQRSSSGDARAHRPPGQRDSASPVSEVSA